MPTASRASAAKRIRFGSIWSAVAFSAFDLDAADQEVAAGERGRRSAASPKRVGDRRVDVELGDARAADREVARIGVHRDALAGLGLVEGNVGVDGAGRLDQRERGERRDVGRLQRQPPGRPARSPLWR